MGDDLKELVDRSREVKMTPADKEAQRRSFVYGNTKIENEHVTREIVEEVGDNLDRREKKV